MYSYIPFKNVNVVFDQLAPYRAVGRGSPALYLPEQLVQLKEPYSVCDGYCVHPVSSRLSWLPIRAIA